MRLIGVGEGRTGSSGMEVLGQPSRRKATMEVTAPELRPLHREGSSLCESGSSGL